GPPHPAYVLSSVPARYSFTVSNIEKALPGYFKFEHFQAIPFNDTRINGNVRQSSNLLSHIDMWLNLSSRSDHEYGDNDWCFVFEDDVNIVDLKNHFPHIYSKWNYSNPHHSLRGIIEQALKLADLDGILYLGTCGPEYPNNNSEIIYTSDNLFEFRRGAYFCSHATAFKKWRLKTLWIDYSVYQPVAEFKGVDGIAKAYQIISKKLPLSMASNIHWPPGTGHFGFFFQDRGAHKSTIDVRKPAGDIR
ncbi:unnamed protein product, partial [Didymodactylos carnosus]